MSKPDTDVTMSDGDFSKLRAIVHQNTGITIGETRKTMLVSRLRRRLREVGEPSFAAYISRLSSDPEEMQELTNRVTTNETYFYRTPRVWNYFQEVYLPEYLANGPDRRMRVWSAAASTGSQSTIVHSGVGSLNPSEIARTGPTAMVLDRRTTAKPFMSLGDVSSARSS